MGTRDSVRPGVAEIRRISGWAGMMGDQVFDRRSTAPPSDEDGRVEWSLDLDLSSRSDAPMSARRALEGIGTRLEPVAMDTLRLLVSEVVTNSVRHARVDGDAKIRIRVRGFADTVRVEVADDGPGFAAVGRQAGQGPASGWGLYLLDRLATRWGIAERPTRVWFELSAQDSRSDANC